MDAMTMRINKNMNKINSTDVAMLRHRSHRSYTFDNDVLYCSNISLIYTAVSKNGCSTMKAYFYHLENFPKFLPQNVQPHNRVNTGLKGAAEIGDDQFGKLLSNSSIPKVTIVRNPFSRIVSCYLNRVADFGTETYDLNRRFDEWVYNRIKILDHKTGRRCTFDEAVSTEISFSDFVEFVCEQADFEMDRHWVPQSAAIYHDVIEYDYIGRLEKIDEAQKCIADIVGADSKWQTGARLNRSGRTKDYSDFFDSKTLKLFLDRFRTDFELFDYSTDPSAC